MWRFALVVAVAAMGVNVRAVRADDEVASPWFGRISLVEGSREVGALDMRREGFAFALGVGRLTFSVYGEVQLTLQHADGLRGLGADVALHARRFVHYIDFGGAIVACWADVGVGVQGLVSHDASVHRPGVSLGFGGGGLFTEHGKRNGLELELRIEAAPSTNVTGLARCSGGCAPSSSTDFGASLFASYPFSL